MAFTRRPFTEAQCRVMVQAFRASHPGMEYFTADKDGYLDYIRDKEGHVIRDKALDSWHRGYIAFVKMLQNEPGQSPSYSPLERAFTSTADPRSTSR